MAPYIAFSSVIKLHSRDSVKSGTDVLQNIVHLYGSIYFIIEGEVSFACELLSKKKIGTYTGRSTNSKSSILRPRPHYAG